MHHLLYNCNSRWNTTGSRNDFVQQCIETPARSFASSGVWKVCNGPIVKILSHNKSVLLYCTVWTAVYKLIEGYERGRGAGRGQEGGREKGRHYQRNINYHISEGIISGFSVLHVMKRIWTLTVWKQMKWLQEVIFFVFESKVLHKSLMLVWPTMTSLPTGACTVSMKSWSLMKFDFDQG